MTRIVPSLAVVYVMLLLAGRSGLPMNAQWADLVLPVLAIAVWRGRPLREWWRSGDWAIVFYLGVTLATALVSTDPRVGLGQLAKQLSVVLILVVFRQFGDVPGLSRTLAETFATSLAAITLLSIPVVFLGFPLRLGALHLGALDTLPFFGTVTRLRAGFVTPEMLGNALLVAFVLALGFRAQGQGAARVFWTVIAATLVVGEFLTFSHSVAGFAVAAALLGSGAFRSRATRAMVWSVALLVVILVNAASVIELGRPANDYGVRPVTVRFMGVGLEGELNHYAALKQVAWSAFLDHPVSGVGPGRFATETERAFRDGRFRARYRNKPAQCDLLGRLAETGILGGLSLLALWAGWLRRGLSLPEDAVLQRAAFAAVVGLLVNSVNADVMNFRFLWLAVALMDAGRQGEDATPK